MSVQGAGQVRAHQLGDGDMFRDIHPHGPVIVRGHTRGCLAREGCTYTHLHQY